MTELGESLLAGLGSGAVYAVIALGFVAVYRSTGVISFTQPAFLLTGAVTVSVLAPGVGFAFACVCAVVATSFLAYAIGHTVLRPLLGRPVFAVVVVTIALDIVIRVVAGGFVGVEPRTLGDPWGLDVTPVAGMVVQHRHVVAMVACVVIVCLLDAHARWSRSALAARATFLDREAASAQGVNVPEVQARAWALGAALAAVGGILVSLGSAFDQGLWTVALVALPVMVVGGLDSWVGALGAGLALGVVEALVSTYESRVLPGLDTSLSTVIPYVVMVVILLVRPHGLRGGVAVDRL